MAAVSVKTDQLEHYQATLIIVLLFCFFVDPNNENDKGKIFASLYVNISTFSQD